MSEFMFHGFNARELKEMIVFYKLHHSPNNQAAFDLDVLLDDVQARIAADNEYIGRRNDDLSKRVRAMRHKLLENLLVA